VNQLPLVNMEAFSGKPLPPNAERVRVCSKKRPMQEQLSKPGETWLHLDARKINLVEAKCPHCGAEFEV
jgi:hypothetical protein